MATSKVALPLTAFAIASVVALANPARDAIVQKLSAEAKATDPNFAGFSAERGAAFYRAQHKGGQEGTPSCTSCHGASPKDIGQTRAGKPIEPLAVSLTPSRFTDPQKVERWFDRNCKGVLGRVCTAQEKGDFIVFMVTQ
jgi:hypothetical protein